MDTTHITIRLFATLTRFAPEASDMYPIQPGITIRELLARLGIPESEAKLIFVNNQKVAMDTELVGGERVGIFPPIGGG
jgi:molybdopterin converting factor small subunit